jgi:uncharacterized membrane protein
MSANATAVPVAVPVTPGRWISMGWNIVRDDLGNFLVITLISVALTLAVSFTVVGIFLLGGPLLAGLFFATRRRILEGRMEIMDVFCGFNRFLDTFLIYLLSTLFALVGLTLCIFPVFVVLAAYPFPYLFAVDRGLVFWDALEASRKLASRDLTGYIIFAFLLVLLNLVGLMLAGIGVLFTIPVSVAAITVAYKEVVGFHAPPAASRGPVIIP